VGTYHPDRGLTVNDWKLTTGVAFDDRRELWDWYVRWDRPDGSTVPVRSGSESTESVAETLAYALSVLAERRGVGKFVAEQLLTVGGIQ
jgi:hypothetical protein